MLLMQHALKHSLLGYERLNMNELGSNSPLWKAIWSYLKHEKTNWPHELKIESNVECITQRSIKDSIIKRPTKSEYLHVKCL
jgi:hypothetical protein